MNLDQVRDDYLAAALRGDRRGAFALIDAARAAGADIRSVYEGIFQPAQRVIGRLWQQNRITVADEHLATAITSAAMTRVYDELFDAPRRDGCTVVAACIDTERHELGLRMVCDLMELEGWDTCFLGAAVPLESLVSMVRERKPRAVALSVALTAHLPRLQATIEGLREALGEDAPLIVVGGRPFHDNPSLGSAIGADVTAATAQEAIEAIEASHR